MSNIAPSPGSSSSGGEDNGNDKSNSKGAPPSPGASSSSSSPSDSRGDSSQSPPSPSSSGGSRSSSPSDSQDSSSSSPPSPSGNSPPSSSSPSPSSQPSPPSSSNGGNSNSSPPPSPPSNSSPDKGSSNSPQNSGNSNSSSPPGKSSSPPQQSGGSSPSPPSPSSSQSPSAQSGDSSSSSSRAPPPRSSPAPPQESDNGESTSSQPSPRTPSSSSLSPPPPTNQSVVFVPVLVVPNGPPGALPPPGSVAISPGSSITSTNLRGSSPSSQVANAGSQQVTDSSGTSSSGNSSSTNSDISQSSSLASSRVGTSHIAAAIAGATITGLMFVVVAVFLVVWRRKKKRSPDGIVYHNHDGSYYVHSGQLGGANQSGMLYHPPPPGASAGFSYGPASGADNAGGGGGYYQQQSGIMASKSSFSYEELTSITSNFSRDNVIGEGGFGCVYKGWLADGKCVAVKQLKAGSGQGECEFQAEVEIISRVHHRHLVSLVGYCVAAHHRMLIYEFVPNGTLEHHLHGRGVPVMDWPTRLRIAIGAAKGLAYLHEDCHPRIIHRDIKSANILLDYSFEAQVADFGLAKLSNDMHTHVSTRIMGTFGYLAPEYASSGKLTDRSDVFSFGVVLLELITGRKPVDQTRPPGEESLVEWARPVLADAVDTGDLDALVDPRLEGAYNRGEMMVMVEAAAACVRHSAPKRPRMVQVMRALDDDAGGMSDLTNGVKVGQSRAYGSGNHVAAVQQLRLTAFASEEFTGEFEHGGVTDSETQRRLG